MSQLVFDENVARQMATLYQAWAAEQRELGARGELFFAGTQFCFTALRAA
jgi:hypothetical protein